MKCTTDSPSAAHSAFHAPYGSWCISCTLHLKHVQDKLVALVVPALLGILVVPLAVVHGNPHFGRIAKVQALGATVILVAPEILRVEHVGVVVAPLPIVQVICAPPHPPVSPLLRRGARGRETDRKEHGARERR